MGNTKYIKSVWHMRYVKHIGCMRSMIFILFCMILTSLASGIIITGFASEAGAGSLWNEENEAEGSLFADHKARGVGDIITILIYEHSEVSNDSQKVSGKEYEAGIDMNAGISKMIPIANAGVESGSAQNERMTSRGRITAEISARIVESLPGNNLRIEGSRTIVVNGEKQEIVISGIIRSRDITPENTILSTLVADAEIRFTGKPELKKSGNFLSDIWNSITHFFKQIF